MYPTPCKTAWYNNEIGMRTIRVQRVRIKHTKESRSMRKPPAVHSVDDAAGDQGIALLVDEFQTNSYDGQPWTP
jgi:hypothetical protein